jgi:hypothetical protein
MRYDGHNDMEETRRGELGNEDSEDKSLWALLSKCM